MASQRGEIVKTNKPRAWTSRGAQAHDVTSSAFINFVPVLYALVYIVSIARLERELGLAPFSFGSGGARVR